MARKNLDTQNLAYVDSDGGDSFAPIPEGEYLASVFDVKNIEYARQGVNAGRPGINVQFRLVDGRPHANRRVFDRVPMFTTFAPKEAGEKGKNAFRFFQFWAAVLGEKRTDFEKRYKQHEEENGAGSGFDLLLENEELLGKQVVVKIEHEQSDYHFEAAEKNGTLNGRTIDHEDFTREIVADILPASADTGQAAPTLPSGGTFSL